jgi:protein arginine kinase
MNFDSLLHGETGWFRTIGPEADVVFSSRIRLARNLKKLPFPNRASEGDKRRIREEIEKAVLLLPQFQKSYVLHMEELTAIDKQFLSERYLVSRELATKDKGSSVVIDDREILTVMINEEDHIRMQALFSGFRLWECWETIQDIDKRLQKDLEFAFSDTLGYLTSCPTNVGTGIRVSTMLHLPGLIMAKQIEQVLQAIIKLGLTIRGLYGEGTEWSGNLFQISNQVTLGRGEEEIISSIEKVVRQVVQNERNARNQILKNNSEALYDKVGRAYGILSNAHLITTRETIDHLSTLRMGIDLSIINRLNKDKINELFILSQPAHIQKTNGKELDAGNRDIERGNLLRSRLTNN